MRPDPRTLVAVMTKVKCPACSGDFWMFAKSPEDITNSEHLTCTGGDVQEEPNLITTGASSSESQEEVSP